MRLIADFCETQVMQRDESDRAVPLAEIKKKEEASQFKAVGHLVLSVKWVLRIGCHWF